jgi:hypothetical protein
VDAGALGALLADLEQRAPAVRGPQGRALAVGADLEVASASRAEPIVIWAMRPLGKSSVTTWIASASRPSSMPLDRCA